MILSVHRLACKAGLTESCLPACHQGHNLHRMLRSYQWKDGMHAHQLKACGSFQFIV